MKIYNSFAEAIKSNFDVDVKMNEVFKGYVDIDKDIAAIKMTRGRPNNFVRNQNFEIKQTKSGKKVFTYWVDHTELEPNPCTDKLLIVFEKPNPDAAAGFIQGVFKYAKTDKNGRHYYRRVAFLD